VSSIAPGPSVPPKSTATTAPPEQGPTALGATAAHGRSIGYWLLLVLWAPVMIGLVFLGSGLNRKFRRASG
jgi:hypothetical protein